MAAWLRNLSLWRRLWSCLFGPRMLSLEVCTRRATLLVRFKFLGYATVVMDRLRRRYHLFVLTSHRIHPPTASTASPASTAAAARNAPLESSEEAILDVHIASSNPLSYRSPSRSRRT